MKFGDYECSSVLTGIFALDGGAMFGVVPKVLWEKKIPADEKNRIPLATRSLLIRGKGKNILVDTGMGDKWSEKNKAMFKVDQSEFNIDASLARLGLKKEDITDVILTHLHFDHTGGSTLLKDGKLVPAFPNARWHIQKSSWEAGLNPSLRDKASHIEENFMPLKDAGVLNFLDGPGKLFEGIELLVSNGHSASQQHPLIKGEKASLFYCGDIIPTSAHIPVPWHMAYDNHPLIILEEKQRFLERALKENWALFFEHDPKIIAAFIKKGEKGVEISDVLRL